MIKLDNISKINAGHKVLNEVTFTVAEGECLALLGPSGCGKTTLLRLIAGFDAPDCGEIRINRIVVSGNGSLVPPNRRGLSMVFQDLALWPHMTVWTHLDFVIGAQIRNKKARNAKITGILEQVQLENYAQTYPQQLSGGERQRLALGRALAQNPQILLLDEPLSNLDPALKTKLLDEIKALVQKFKMTVIYVTHDYHEAVFIADRIAVMTKTGRIENIYPNVQSSLQEQFDLLSPDTRDDPFVENRFNNKSFSSVGAARL